MDPIHVLISTEFRLARLKADVAAANVILSLQKLARAVAEAKAGYNPNQPRDDRGRWTDGSNSPAPTTASPLPLPPKTPAEKPSTAKGRNRVIKEVAKWLVKAALRQTLGPIGTALTIAEVASWVYGYAPYIEAYLDDPKSIEELQQAVASPQKGYDAHHIVEQASAEEDGFPRSQIDAPKNLVRISTLKHWEITGWYMTKNEDYTNEYGEIVSPREYLRQKDWKERTRVGLYALVRFGVLKP
jgi:hypothetical protein